MDSRMLVFLCLTLLPCVVNMVNHHRHNKKQKTQHDEDEASTTGVSQSVNTTPDKVTDIFACLAQNEDGSPLEFGPSPDRQCFVKGLPPPFGHKPCGTGCDSHLVKLSSLSSVSKEDRYAVGTVNEADLLLSRAAGIFDWETQDLTSKYVCKLHMRLLGYKYRNRPRAQFGGQKQDKCSYPDIDGFPAHSGVIKAERYAETTKQQSQAIMDQKSVFVPVGQRKMLFAYYYWNSRNVNINVDPLPVAKCTNHRTYVDDLLAQYLASKKNYQLRPLPAKTLADSPKLPNSLAAILRRSEQRSLKADKDPDFIPEEQTSEGEASQEIPARISPQTANIRKYVTHIANECGVKRLHFTDQFSVLSEYTKRDRAYAVRGVLNAVYKAVASDDPDGLRNWVERSTVENLWTRSSPKLDEIMKAVKESYSSVATASMRTQVLSIVASVMTYGELLKYIPGVTPHYFKAARRLSRRNTHQQLALPDAKRVKYEKRKVVGFISFITSPHIVTQLPFGFKTIRYSSGQKEQIASLMRSMVNERIVRQYSRYLIQSNQEEMSMSRSSLLRILKYCAASTRRSVHGIDYYTYLGGEGFDYLQEIVAKLSASGEEERADHLKQALEDSRNYLKGDYRLHVKEQSRIPDHCLTFALSDTAKETLRKPCDHGLHDMKCARCEQLNFALHDIKEAVETAQFNTEGERSEARYLVKVATESILDWKAHSLRAVVQDGARINVFSSLQDHQIHITLDWAMKFIPTAGREDQSAWYGKRGLSWHIAAIHGQSNNGQRLLQRSFVHVFEKVVQDGEAVIGIIRHVLQSVKRERPGVTVAYFKSDNAGCYKSSNLLASLPRLSEETGIHIARYDFSEPQTGKAAADRIASYVKRNIGLFVDQNNPCRTADEFLRSGSSDNGVKATSIVQSVAKIRKAREPAKISDITKYNNFAFHQTSQSITAWKSYQIGSGVIIPRVQWYGKHSATTIEAVKVFHENQLEGAVLLNDDRYWRIFGDNENEDATAENDLELDNEDDGAELLPFSIDTSPARLFDCPIEGCIRQYATYTNLEKHIETGRHKFRVQRESLRDFALNTYKSQVESMEASAGIPTLSDAINEACTVESGDYTRPLLKLGWAQRTVRPRKAFSVKQRQFLVQKFNEGIANKKKWDAKEVAKAMRAETVNNVPLFEPEEYLRPTQISSFFRYTQLIHSYSSSFTHSIMCMYGNQRASIYSREASRRRGEAVAEDTEEDEREDDRIEDPALADVQSELSENLAASDCFE